MRPYPLIALLTLGFALPATAQIVQNVASGTSPAVADYLGNVRAAVPPVGNAGYEWHDTHDFENGEGTADFWVAELRMPYFYKELGNGGRLALSVDYSYTNLEVASDEFSWDGQLHGLYLPISYTHRDPASQWFWLAQVAPGLRTDFESISSDDFAFRAFVTAIRGYGKNFTLGYGVYLSYDVDQLFVVPGIGFTWKPAEDWLVALIPPQLTLSYEPSDDWAFSLYARPRSFLADIDEGPTGPDIASVKYGKLAFSAKHRLLDSPHVWLNLSVGYTLYSEVELQRGGQSLVEGDLDQGFFAGAAIELLGW